MTTIEIKPIEKFLDPILMNKISITIESLELNVRAYIRVIFYDNDYKTIDTKYLELLQPDYNQWGSDDNFIITWVCQQLNLTPVS